MFPRSLIVLFLAGVLQAPAGAQCQFEESAVTGLLAADKLGSDVVIKGDLAVIGAQQVQTTSFGKKGFVEIYRKKPDGWTLTQTLAPTNFEFGRSVDTDGKRIVVGAPGFNSQRVEIYVFDGTQWVTEQSLFKPGNPFGASVSIYGRWLAVADFIGGQGFPSVFVYKLGHGTWTLDTTFTGPVGSWYGQGLSMSRGLLLIGNPSNGKGTIDVYRLQGGSWQLTQRLESSDPALCRFGWDLSRDKGLIAGTASCPETVVLFEQAGGSWSEMDSVALPPPSLSTFFSGPVVDVRGPLAVVGVPDPSSLGMGHAYLLRRHSDGWSIQKELCQSLTGGNDSSFGSSVSIDTQAIVGNPGFQGTGAAFFYPLDMYLRPALPSR